ncbi:hypothetical protein EUGRSUZ_F04358 [Eucalyptus grandis]|uniref:Uncharacterized protein n=2 Tax=Eucalyptus grandis TaxID=71139 RepID=A0ACC3KQK7_EUCGR|nr:hypothetical protein EUGRSUZ_F04358 [Eucalyptus grandis]
MAMSNKKHDIQSYVVNLSCPSFNSRFWLTEGRVLVASAFLNDKSTGSPPVTSMFRSNLSGDLTVMPLAVLGGISRQENN